MIAKQELDARLDKLCKELGDNWDTAFIINRINQYYFTGTMQDGLLVVKRNGDMFYFVRRSYERAKAESPVENILPMKSYRDAADVIGGIGGTVYMETETVTLGIIERLKKYFNIENIVPVEKSIMKLRSVKSPCEMSILKETGRRHNDFMLNVIPGILREGMTEVEFTGMVFNELVKHGHHGIARFGMFQNETVCGQMGFGTNSLYPTSFDGPGGMKGMSPAAPLIGDPARHLKKGDLVFVDFAYGMDGYHTDKTQMYMFGAKPPEEAVAAHERCMKIESRIADMLKVGGIPSEIYNTVMSELDDEFLKNFMGFENRAAKFLGHGTGLQIDELPVIAKGFDSPLEGNTVMAVEPKKGIAGFGLVGVEDTYAVTANGGACLTGGGCEIIRV